MRRAFVTGGSGFVGGRLLRRLSAEGWQVNALARSSKAADVVSDRGASPTRGDLFDVAAMTAGATGCDTFFHVAARVSQWGTREQFYSVNVDGTHNALRAAKAAGVARFVYVSTEAVLLDGNPVHNANETFPVRKDSKALYCATKAAADEIVRQASDDALETIAIRPRFVWGAGDSVLLPEIVDFVQTGKWFWVGRGQHRASTTHVDNLVEALILAVDQGRPGSAYFVSDGCPSVVREFISSLLATQGVAAPARSLPRWLARVMAAAGETAWRAARLRGSPPLTRMELYIFGIESTLDISRARAELNYAPVKTIAEGMLELRNASSELRMAVTS